jgi:hypothetical protein
MCHSTVYVLSDWVTGMDHESVHKLHGLCPLASELARDDDFASLGTTFHDEAKDTVACSAKAEWEDQHLTHGIPYSLVNKHIRLIGV